MSCLRCDEPWPVDDYEAGCPRCAADGHASNLKLTYAQAGQGLRLPYPACSGLGEGGTPCIELPELAQELDIGRLSAKLEWYNPTGSHKDRMSAQLLPRAGDRGAATVVAASSGNGGVSIAAYAARYGLRSEIAVTGALPAAYREALAAHAADLVICSDSMARWSHVARRVGEGAFAATNYKIPAIGTNPFGIEGYKTLAAELAREGLPDVVVVPTARGDLLSGLRLGFEELGVPPPELVAAEPFPRLSKVLAGADYRESFAGDTAQASIAGSTVTWQALAALRATSGQAIAVDDAASRAARSRLVRLGLEPELSAASALAALAVLAGRGTLAGRHAVILLTGSSPRASGARAVHTSHRNDARRPGPIAQPANTGASQPRTDRSVQQRENG